MKKVIFFFLLILTAAPLSAQDWEMFQNSVDDHINGIHILGDDTVFIVTKAGQMARSDHQNKYWGEYEVTTGKSIEDIVFFDMKTGFLCGQQGTLLRTINGCLTWDTLLQVDTTVWFFDIEMIDSLKGIVVGLNRTKQTPLGGVAFVTQDGGNTWQQVFPGGLGYSQALYDEGKLFLLTFGRIAWSFDNGLTWDSSPTHEGQPGRAFSKFGNTFIIAGLNGTVLSSDNGGRIWAQGKLNDRYNFVAAQMVSETEGYIGGAPDLLFVTHDAGKNWSEEPMPEKFSIFDFFLTDNYLYAVGTNGKMMRKKIQ